LYIQKVIKNHSNRAYIVGGACRDFFLNTTIRDIDIEVYDIDIEKFNLIMQDIGADGVGAKFFVYKYKNHIDISLARKDNKVSNGHNGFDVSYVETESRAILRRDFNMNAIMINIFNFNILDLSNGLDDLKNKKISIINKKTFKEDSLRLLRAVGFASRLGFKIDNQSEQILNSMNLEDIHRDRILQECEKIFKGDSPHYGFFYMMKFNLLDEIFNINQKKINLLKTYREFKKLKDNKTKYHFLYIILSTNSIPFKLISKSNTILSKDYKNIFKNQIKIPINFNNKFLYAIALKMPIKDYLGSYNARVFEVANSKDIFDKKLDISSITNDLIKGGFSGISFKTELIKRCSKMILDL